MSKLPNCENCNMRSGDKPSAKPRNIAEESVRVGQAVARLRERAGMTAEALAAAMRIDNEEGIDVKTLSKLEGGQFKRASRLGELAKAAADALGVNVETLYAQADPSPGSLLLVDQCMFFGQTRTLWVRRFGDGTAPLKFEDVKCVFVDEEIDFPPALYQARLESKQRIEADPRLRNGSLAALVDITHRYIGDEERPALSLKFGLSRYADFLAIANHPSAHEVKRTHLRGWDLKGTPIPFLSQGVGIHVVVTTADEKIVFTRRSSDVGPRRGQLDVGVVEGISRHLETQGVLKAGANFNIEETFRRGIREEFGLPNSLQEGLELLGLGYDLQYGQWNFLGHCKANCTFSELVRFWQSDSKTPEEYSELYPVGLSPTDIAARVKREAIWSSALAALRYSTIRRMGSAEAFNRAFADVGLENEHQYDFDVW